MENLAHLKTAIAAVDLAQTAWEATAPGFHTEFRSRMSTIAGAAGTAGADDVAARASRWADDAGLTHRIFDTFTEPVSDLIAATSLELRDALYAQRGGSAPMSVKTFWELLPRVESGTIVMPPPFEYPVGLDEAQVREVIQPLVENLDGLVAAFDFDGTVAPLQPGETAKDTRADPMTNAVLTALGMRARKVVMISARHPSELLAPDRIQPTSGLVIYGNDGLSRWSTEDGITYPTLTADDMAGIAEARLRIQPFLDDGLRLEDKGISFEVLVPVGVNLEEADAILEIIKPKIDKIAANTGLTAVRNATYWSLRPDGPDKGVTLSNLKEEFDASALLFAGDSTNDGSAFRVINALRAAGFPAVGLLSASSHSPDGLKDLATLVVPGPAGVLAVNRELARSPLPEGIALTARGGGRRE